MVPETIVSFWEKQGYIVKYISTTINSYECLTYFRISDISKYDESEPILNKNILAFASNNPLRKSRYRIGGKWYDEDAACKIVKLLLFL